MDPAASDPPPGSVRLKKPIFSPLISGGTYLSICCLVPQLRIVKGTVIAWALNVEPMPGLTREISSQMIARFKNPSSEPPYSSGKQAP